MVFCSGLHNTTWRLAVRIAPYKFSYLIAFESGVIIALLWPEQRIRQNVLVIVNCYKRQSTLKQTQWKQGKTTGKFLPRDAMLARY